MSNWSDRYLPEAKKDLEKLDSRQKKLVKKAVLKVLENPLPGFVKVKTGRTLS